MTDTRGAFPESWFVQAKLAAADRDNLLNYFGVDASWKAICSHAQQIRRNCEPGDIFCRPRQRQALLHWAYDSRLIYASARCRFYWRPGRQIWSIADILG